MINCQKILIKLYNNKRKRFFDLKTNIASRQSSASVLEGITNSLPELIGGSADLSGSNNTNTKHSVAIKPQILKETIFIMVLESMLWQE